MLKALQEKFLREVGSPELLVTAPGRANIIGEHIDYCKGYVLPFAITQAMLFLSKKRSDGKMVFHSYDFDQNWAVGERSDFSWSGYLEQIIELCKDRGFKWSGADVYFGSEIPMGAGLSSSTALCCGVIALLSEMNEWCLSKEEIIDLASLAEHGRGLQGGKMDQYAIMFGKKGKAVYMDCIDHSFELIPIQNNKISFLIINSGVEHELVHSEYNTRRAELFRGLDLVNERGGERISFRELTEELSRSLEQEYPVESRRLRHVISEIARTRKAIEFLGTEASALGRLLYASHDSLRDDYQVSCKELDYIVAYLQESSGVYGARMMGGGFGGCVIALVDVDFREETLEALKGLYRNEYGLELSWFAVEPSEGLKVEWL